MSDPTADLDIVREHLTEMLNDHLEGRVVCERVAHSSGALDEDGQRRLLALLARERALPVEAEHLVETPPEVARSVATTLLTKSAFGDERRPRAEVLADVERFFSAFEPDARFWSTWRYNENDADGYAVSGRQLVPNSFDLGFLVFDTHAVGFFAVGDED